MKIWRHHGTYMIIAHICNLSSIEIKKKLIGQSLFAKCHFVKLLMHKCVLQLHSYPSQLTLPFSVPTLCLAWEERPILLTS